MTTKTSTTIDPKSKRTTLKTESTKVSTLAKKTEKKTTPVKDSTVAELYPQAMQLVQLSNKQGISFFWQEYSERCAAITGENFETVYYFAFATEQAAIDFVNAISGKFCKDCSYRSSKRFDPDKFSYEVKIWGMSQATFFCLVKRDLARK